MVENGIISRSIICASSIASAKAVASCIVPHSSKWGEKDLK